MFGDFKLKEQLYRTLCQNPDCREALGGIHLPCVGGLVIFRCAKCGTVSQFKNGPYGFEVTVLGKTKPGCTVSSPEPVRPRPIKSPVG